MMKMVQLQRFVSLLFVMIWTPWQVIYSAEWRHENVTIPILDIFSNDNSETLPPIKITIGKPMFVGLHKAGGSGYYWEAAVADPDLLTAKYVRSRSEKGDDVNIVGSPEADIFDIQPLRPGDTDVVFTLQRVKSNPIREITVHIHVGR